MLVFVRAPEPGRVKTRLTGKLDPQGVARLYRCFVEDVLATLSNRSFRVTICYDPPDAAGKLKSWLGASHDFMAQKGPSLGARMAHAFQTVFEQGVGQALLIGSDLPDLDAGVIDEAFDSLSAHDLVVGPSMDGGYYLIGFNAASFAPLLFENICWSTPRVLEETVDGVQRAGLRMHRLPMWRDIDTPDDLADFFTRSKAKGLTHLKTVQYLEQNRVRLDFDLL